jgi:hypothetical protein
VRFARHFCAICKIGCLRGCYCYCAEHSQQACVSHGNFFFAGEVVKRLSARDGGIIGAAEKRIMDESARPATFAAVTVPQAPREMHKVTAMSGRRQVIREAPLPRYAVFAVNRGFTDG